MCMGAAMCVTQEYTSPFFGGGGGDGGCVTLLDMGHALYNISKA